MIGANDDGTLRTEAGLVNPLNELTQRAIRQYQIIEIIAANPHLTCFAAVEADGMRERKVNKNEADVLVINQFMRPSHNIHVIRNMHRSSGLKNDLVVHRPQPFANQWRICVPPEGLFW